MRSKETRIERMNKQLMRDFSDIIRTELKLPESFKLLSVTRVTMAPDQSMARVYVSHLKEGETAPAVTALNARAYEIRECLMPRLAWRKIPTVSFHEDDSLKHGFELIRKIESLTRPPEAGP
ncbi:MAG: ribosome-binding factor A [Candidatus Lindowbacteria bacterium RIFCSPLOWO2_12_FULL_62_27]|nr:MAG: ribosome-binding factor A [Candidatus Lindowbacteria bacterium RIFCSPLOWO2_02_FULL_62_12]OGH62681.1 MAG: ribosome-binding factor A [Candidatus Lindowbacteria bacterium RIFCSPLOWO2_12_FULL_62_27]